MTEISKEEPIARIAPAHHAEGQAGTLSLPLVLLPKVVSISRLN